MPEYREDTQGVYLKEGSKGEEEYRDPNAFLRKLLGLAEEVHERICGGNGGVKVTYSSSKKGSYGKNNKSEVLRLLEKLEEVNRKYRELEGVTRIVIYMADLVREKGIPPQVFEHISPYILRE